MGPIPLQIIVHNILCKNRRPLQFSAEPYSSVGSLQYLRTASLWFDPGSANILFFLSIEDSHCDDSHRCPLLRQWVCGKAASDLERIMCEVLVKRTPGKHE